MTKCLRELDNRNLLTLMLRIADTVFVRYNHTIETLNLLKNGYDILYSFKTNYHYNEKKYFHDNEVIQEGCQLIARTLYNYNKKHTFYTCVYYTIIYFANYLAIHFTEKQLILSYLTFVNGKKYNVNGMEKYMITNVTGKIKTKDHFFKEYLDNDKYYRYYIEKDKIVLKCHNDYKIIIPFNVIMTANDFNKCINIINKSNRDYQYYLYKKRMSMYHINEMDLKVIV